MERAREGCLRYKKCTSKHQPPNNKKILYETKIYLVYRYNCNIYCLLIEPV